jgi:aminopeptidase N
VYLLSLQAQKYIMQIRILLAITLLTLALGCGSTKNSTASQDVVLDQIEVIGKKMPYRASATRKHDLLHTKLSVKFDWENQHLHGEAWLDLKPYFYTTNVLELDAKGMDIKEVALTRKDNVKLPLEYTYDGMKLNIQLDKNYNRKETYSIYINYVSKPNELPKTEGLSAISNDKGLYFINPLGEEKNKPRQIWTQGEPESNSVWFPTIDNPNERCTQEIFITVDTGMVAMSNGVLIGKVNNGDGTQTLHWKQDLPHAPYLFMMTIGEFAVVEDTWEGLSVNYFVEKEYENVAKRIFGNTPEMLTFFSDLLGVKYPWDKYWQVCVRDYVSGAMENTSAVIFGEFVQRNERELLDEDYEDIVSHELFHHWFGDLVTCESWSNLPLNESFATYGEVLWREYKYGMDEKNRKVWEDMQSYFAEAARGKQVDMIRYHHETAEDMFDSHSYAKGGTILNMLRDYVGDEAFFESLKVYLIDNLYSAVEIHHLRLAFEKVTGEDLNWFFNQWFLNAGHPEIEINYLYTDSSVIVKLAQDHSVGSKLTYKIPLNIGIYESNTYKEEAVVFDKKTQEFEFLTSKKPFLVNVDTDKSLLAQFADNKTPDEWMFQYMNGKNFLDRLYAVNALLETENVTDDVYNVLRFALNDSSWYIQELVAQNYPLEATDKNAIEILKNLVQHAEKTQVVAAAILKLSELEDKSHEPIFATGLKHPSYLVNGAALEAMAYVNADLALATAAQWEEETNYDIKAAVGSVYAEFGDISKRGYFEKTATHSDESIDRIYAVYYYSMFLSRMDNKTALEGVKFIEEFGKNDDSRWGKNVAISSLGRIRNAFAGNAEILKKSLKTPGLSKAQKLEIENEMIEYKFVVDRTNEAIARLNKTSAAN